MTRRTASLVAAGAVLGLLVLVGVFLPLPYVVMSPGLTEDTLGSYNGTKVIQIDGHQVYRPSGKLSFTTVSVTSPDRSPSTSPRSAPTARRR